jgi:hypothetical protein
VGFPISPSRILSLQLRCNNALDLGSRLKAQILPQRTPDLRCRWAKLSHGID